MGMALVVPHFEDIIEGDLPNDYGSSTQASGNRDDQPCPNPNPNWKAATAKQSQKTTPKKPAETPQVVILLVAIPLVETQPAAATTATSVAVAVQVLNHQRPSSAPSSSSACLKSAPAHSTKLHVSRVLHSRAQLLSKQLSTQIAHACLSKKHSARTRKLKQPASAQKYHKVAVRMAKRVTSDFKTGHTFVATPTVLFQPTLLFATSRIHVKKVHSVSLPHRVRLREAACRPANAKFSV